MTYAEAVALRDAINAALLSGAGVSSLQVGDRTITYESPADARRMLNQLNRDIAAYNNKAANRNPSRVTPRW